MEGFPCETYYYRIGSNIRRLRRERHMTQEGLAEAAGLSLKMIQKLEVGQKGFRMETIIKIALTLDVSLDVLADMRKVDKRRTLQQEAFYAITDDTKEYRKKYKPE